MIRRTFTLSLYDAMINPFKSSHEDYAKTLTQRKKSLAKTTLSERVARELEEVIKNRMEAIMTRGETHFTTIRTHCSNGQLFLAGLTSGALEQQYTTRACIPFNQNRRQLVLAFAKRLVMGKGRFGEHVARKLIHTLARNEAEILHLSGGSPTDISLTPPSSYRKTLDAELRRLDRKPFASVLAESIAAQAQHLMTQAREAGFSQFETVTHRIMPQAIRLEATRDGFRDYHTSTIIILRPSLSVRGAMLLLCMARLLPVHLYCSWMAAQVCRNLANQEAEILHLRGYMEPLGIQSLVEKTELLRAAPAPDTHTRNAMARIPSSKMGRL